MRHRSTPVKPPRMRGYRIRTVYQNWYGVTTPTMWLPEAPLSDFEAVISSPNVKYAYLTQSGRVLRKYDPEEERRTAPLGDNRTFSLMR